MSKDWMKKKSKFECWIFEFQKFSKLSIFDDVDDGLSSFKNSSFFFLKFPSNTKEQLLQDTKRDDLGGWRSL